MFKVGEKVKVTLNGERPPLICPNHECNLNTFSSEVEQLLRNCNLFHLT